MRPVLVVSLEWLVLPDHPAALVPEVDLELPSFTLSSNLDRKDQPLRLLLPPLMNPPSKFPKK